jgi:hypothetical protein
MAAHSSNLSIIEVVETLSNIADLEFDGEIGITQRHEIVLGNEKIAYKTVHWLHEIDAASTVNLVRETFCVILHYLKQFYKKEYEHVTDQKTLEGIKTIMVLVGEAAKKLDKYREFFHQTQSVMESKDFKQLQELYRSKITQKIDDGVLSQWILGLPLEKSDKQIDLRALPEKSDQSSIDIKHIFVDLEMVKRDSEYELFFILKDDGSHFFSPRLLRNIKLVCDFGNYFGERKELDPLEHIKHWYDRTLHMSAKEILKNVSARLGNFFLEARKGKDHELIVVLNKAILALMLSSHSQNLLKHHPSKSCTEYFEDFQGFLREALQTAIYQKWLAYPPKENNQLAFELLDLLHSLCRALYANLQGLEEMKPVIHDLIQKAHEMVSKEHLQEMAKSKKIGSQLAEDYAGMSKLFKHHPNGPLFKALEILDEGAFHAFDSLLQHNLPNQLFDLFNQDKRCSFLRIPAPTYQEYINKAVVNEEFKGFIRSYKQGAAPRKHLLINLQDRTSWREHTRSLALEDLQKMPEMEKALSVATLATDTDFYHQLAPYHQVNQAHLFKEQFKELLLDENAGYFFPASINRHELSHFIDHSFDTVHRVFFSNKNVMMRENRLDFIEIFYFLLQLKLIEWEEPDSVSLTCKDSIDTGEAFSLGVFVFLKLINGQEWTEDDWQHLNFMLYAPSILIRERLMLPECFNRMLSALKVVENMSQELGRNHLTKVIEEKFSRLYQTPILCSQLLLPR